MDDSNDRDSRRTVTAPGDAAAPGQVISVELGEDEDVEWQWTHDADGSSRVTGYRIVPRAAA